MPIALEPGLVIRVSLEIDADRPEAERPYFECQVLSARAWKRIAGLMASFHDGDDVGETIGRVAELVDVLPVVGWGNMRDPLRGNREIPFNREDLDRLLTISEVMELAQKCRGLGADDLKNSGSPSPCATGASAKDAPAPDPTASAPNAAAE